MNDVLLRQMVAAHKWNKQIGIYSICSAHPFVLETGLRHAMEMDEPLVIESTCNQVNQSGGYTGMTPAGFRTLVSAIVADTGFPWGRLILGGDHLGPNPWKHEPVESAMAKARLLVQDCVSAGYAKIHLDTSMKCADDPVSGVLQKSVCAERAAELCAVAELAWKTRGDGEAPPCYIVGTEVPSPGGGEAQAEQTTVTGVEDARETIFLTHQAFRQRGLDAAWERVVAVVVQPGVEFSDSAVVEYDRRGAAELSRLVETYDHLVYEAHSTDYQTRDALRALVEDHFAILKVGPALTFAFREGVFALAGMEREWLSGRRGVVLSGIQEVLDNVMVDQPGYWQRYVSPEEDAAFARRFGFSDRSRYYWPDVRVQEAFARLIDNLSRRPAPITLLSQFLPEQYERVRAGVLANEPKAWVRDKIRHVLADYSYACGGGKGGSDHAAVAGAATTSRTAWSAWPALQ